METSTSLVGSVMTSATTFIAQECAVKLRVYNGENPHGPVEIKPSVNECGRKYKQGKQ